MFSAELFLENTYFQRSDVLKWLSIVSSKYKGHQRRGALFSDHEWLFNSCQQRKFYVASPLYGIIIVIRKGEGKWTNYANN